MSGVIQTGISAKGRSELKKFVSGKRLSSGQALKAKCYDCMGGYDGGKVDCGVSGCPLYGYMPYRGIEPPLN